MLLSTETNSIIKRFGEEKSFEILKKSGFDACDYSFYNETAKLLQDDYMEKAKITKALLDKVGLLCNQAHAPFDLVEGEPFEIGRASCRDRVSLCV